MYVVKCTRCERYNHVAHGTLEELKKLKCIRCGTPLPIDQRAVVDQRPPITAADVAMTVFGLAFWPAGLVLTTLLFVSADDAHKLQYKMGYAWVMMGMVLHLALFFFWPPAHDFYLRFWQTLTHLRR